MIVVFLQRTLKKNTVHSHKHFFTPYPSLALTHGQTDRKNKYTRCTWAGGTFFQLCCCVSFLVSGGEQVLVLLTYISRVQYSCGIALVFWFWQEIDVGVTYVLSVHYTCMVVSVFLLWQEIVLWREIVLKMRTPFDFL